MPQLPDLIQQALGSTYEVERELSGGGMSRVVLARDHRLGRRVVVKILPPDLAATVSVDRFRREILVAARLQHPHIIPILTAGEVQGLPYLVMPFVEGESLRAHLAGGPLGVVEAVRILRDVSRALVYAHGRGLVHRDIKPDNVLLSGGSAMVADFGVAKALTFARLGRDETDRTITVVGTSLGTPAYMAPEQIAADPNLDHRADHYALGIMAYEMLAGVTPFHERSPQALLAAHLTEEPAPLSDHRDDLPVALCDLIMRCLEKDPGARPQSAEEIVAALDDPSVISGAFATPTPSPLGAPPSGGIAPTPRSGPTRAATPRSGARAAVPAPAPLDGTGPSATRRWRLAGIAALLLIMLGVGAMVVMRSPDGGAPPSGSRSAAAPVASIAVLPLVFIGSDSAYAYLADGLTNELTSALAEVPGLRVASRAVSGAIQRRLAAGEPVDTALAALLEGTVQREGNRLRVTARLVSARDGYTVWSDVYEREMRDVFALQDGVKTAVVRELREYFELGEPAAAAGADTVERRAGYDDYLRGLTFFERRGGESLRAAQRFFERSIRADSTFAPAWAGLANVYAVIPLYSKLSDVATDSLYRVGLAAATRAIALDPTLAEGYAARGNLHNALWHWEAARRDFAKAIELVPTLATAHQWLGENLLLNGRIEEAVEHLGHAAELTPTSPIINAYYAIALGIGGAHDSAEARAKLAVELDPELAVSRFMLGAIRLYRGEPRAAIRDLEIAMTLADSSPDIRGLLGYAYAKAGMPGQADRHLQAFDGQEADGVVSVAIARIYLGYGDAAKAMPFLERAAERRAPFFSSEPMASPIFDPLRGDPRFIRLVQRIGLDVAGLTTVRRPGSKR